ncbi:MAG: hypothetical protein FWD38_11910 [Oscillospiraceae bacterium]|nr:hypothetical protein [Oscillospiraceae bacterium]
MNNTGILKSLIFLLSSFSFAYCGPIEILFKHRVELEKRAIKYENRRLSNELIKEMRHKDLNEWKKKEDEILKAFLILCAGSGSYPNYHLDDTLLLTLLIETLGELPSQNDGWVNTCFMKVPYPYLNAHRTKIINKLQRVDDISRFESPTALINPPEAMKKQLLASDKRSPAYIRGLRARLGDKKTEEKIVEKMDRAVKMSIGARARFGDEERINNYIDSLNKTIGTYGRWPDASCFLSDDDVIENLLLCGTDECIKTALNFFAKFQPRLSSEGRVKKEQYGICYDRHNEKPNPRELIIMGFRKHHPQLPLLHAEFDSLSDRFYRRSNWCHFDEKEIIEYMEKFVAWGNKEYGTNFRLESKLLFTGQCDNEIRAQKMKEHNGKIPQQR